MQRSVHEIAKRSLFALILLFTISSCKTALELTPVDYSMMLETVLKPDENGLVTDRGYGVQFNVKPVHFMESGDSTKVEAEYRFIRDSSGFYYLTSTGYRNVYIFKPADAKLKLHKQVLITEAGLSKPAFNQRNPIIQLIDGESMTYVLNKDGLVGAQ